MPNIKIDLYRYQADIYKSKKKYVVFCSGTGAGKTWLMPFIAVNSAYEFPGYPILALGPTIKHLKKNLWGFYMMRFLRKQEPYCNVWMEDLGEFVDFVDHDLVEGVDWTLNKTDMRIDFLKTGSSIYGAGFNEPDSYQGVHARRAIVDELGVATKNEPIEVMRQRLNFYREAQLFVGTTPYNQGPLKELFYDEYIEHEKNGTLDQCDIDFFNVSSIANPRYPKDFYEKERERMPKWRWDMMYNGKFTKPAGLIYEKYTTYDPKDVDIEGNIDDYYITGGVDFGFTHPTAILWFAENLKTGDVYLFDEHVASKMDNDAIENVLRKRDCLYYADAAEAGFIETLKNHGINIVAANKGPGSVDAGIRQVDGELRTGKLKISIECIETIKELCLYSRKLDSSGEPLEVILKENDHAMDAKRYNRYSQRLKKESPVYTSVTGRNINKTMKDFLTSME